MSSFTVRPSRKSEPVKNAVFIGAINKDNKKSFRLSSKFGAKINESFDSSDISRVSRSRASKYKNDDVSQITHRMSTPVRQTFNSYRRSSRHSFGKENDRDRSRSTLSISSSLYRRCHPDYDPNIELRRAKERLDQYRSQGDWTKDMLLCDDSKEDLNKYEAKLVRRRSILNENNSDEPIELERRESELLRRQRDIDMGKVTNKYEEYIKNIPKPNRDTYHPRTPNKFRLVSRRAWDGMIKKWRKHLHSYDDVDFSETWRSSVTDVSSRASEVGSDFSFGDVADFVEEENQHNIESQTKEKSVRKSTKDLNTKSKLDSSVLVDENTLEFNPLLQFQAYTNVEDDDETLHAADAKSAQVKQSNFSPVKTRGRNTSGPLLDIVEQADSEPWITVTSKGSRNKRTRNALLLTNCATKIEPTPEVLHCGLTNDIMQLVTDSCPVYSRNKRSAPSLDEVFADENACDSHSTQWCNLKSEKNDDLSVIYSSPNKKQRRMGILASSNITSDVNNVYTTRSSNRKS